MSENREVLPRQSTRELGPLDASDCCRTDIYVEDGELLCCACDQPCEPKPYVDEDYE